MPEFLDTLKGQTIRILGDTQRAYAHKAIDIAPNGAVFCLRQPSRTDEQNRKLWAMCADLSTQARWQGERLDREAWKTLGLVAMKHELHALEYEGRTIHYVTGSRNLTVEQFADLIEVLYMLGAKCGPVQWTDELTGEDG